MHVKHMYIEKNMGKANLRGCEGTGGKWERITRKAPSRESVEIVGFLGD